MAARLNYNSYAITIIILNIFEFNFGITYGFLNTTVLLIGNYVGLESLQDIKKTIKYLSYCLITIYIPLSILFYIFRHEIIMLFTKETYLSNNIDLLMALTALFICTEATHSFLSGIIRGFGSIDFNSTVSFILFSIYMPISCFVLTFLYKLDVLGIILSMLITYLIAIIIWVVYLFWFIDFNTIIENAKNNSN